MSGDSEIFYNRKTHKQLYLCADLTSIMNREKIVGLNTHPWRTPMGQLKKSEYSLFALTQDSKESYIDFIEANNFP